MSDKKKAYVITSGNYSDYSINKVFLDEAKANAYVENDPNSYDMDVEEWDIADDEPLKHRYDILEIKFSMVPDRTAPINHDPTRKAKHRLNELVERNFSHLEGSYKIRTDGPPPECEVSMGMLDGGIMGGFMITGTDQERVRKVATEKMASCRANEDIINYLWRRATFGPNPDL